MAWDWGTAGGGAATGAVMGAAVGSAIPGVGTAIGAGAGALLGGVVGGIAGGEAKESAQELADIQKQAGRAAEIEAYKERRRQAIKEANEKAALKEYTEAGGLAIEQQQALAGLLGPEAQQAAIAQLEASPQFQAMLQQGEQAILANAAATGGVRGGNTQAMLAQFRPQLLSSLIQQQYERLGGMSAAGQQAAVQQANIGLGYGNLTMPLFGQQQAYAYGSMVNPAMTRYAWDTASTEALLGGLSGAARVAAAAAPAAGGQAEGGTV